MILGAANAYLGLRAGQTIAATYPAAVIGMAVLRLFKGSILEENIARTAGSIGESVAAGAIFTLPAFYIAKRLAAVRLRPGAVLEVHRADDGGVGAGRPVRFADPARDGGGSRAAVPRIGGGVGDPQSRAGAARRRPNICSTTSAWARLVYLGGAFNLFAPDHDFFFRVGQLGRSTLRAGTQRAPTRSGRRRASPRSRRPAVSPAYIGVGYIIGPELAALNFSGSVLAWGLLVPLLIFFLGPQLQAYLPAGSGDAGWLGLANAVWLYIVRPIAVGGMMVGAVYTLFRMRKSLMARARQGVQRTARQHPARWNRWAAPSAT